MHKIAKERGGKCLSTEYINIKTKPRFISVDYSGMGWMLVKKGVIESIEYPWFAPVWQDFGNGIKGFTSADVAFCRRIKEQGYDIIVDTS